MNSLRQIERSDKLTFDINEIDEHGLIGAEEGKTLLAFEFCIPQDANLVNEVRTIDPELNISRNPGRIGCSTSEYLVMGETTNQYLKVLKSLVRLDYIKQIDRTWFE